MKKQHRSDYLSVKIDIYDERFKKSIKEFQSWLDDFDLGIANNDFDIEKEIIILRKAYKQTFNRYLKNG